jgi:hypothetical protein
MQPFGTMSTTQEDGNISRDAIDAWERLFAAYTALTFQATGTDPESEKEPSAEERADLRRLSRALSEARSRLPGGDVGTTGPPADDGEGQPATLSEDQVRATLAGIVPGTLGDALEGDPRRGFVFAYMPAPPRHEDPTAPNRIRVVPAEPGRLRFAMVVPDGTDHWVATLSVRS